MHQFIPPEKHVDGTQRMLSILWIQHKKKQTAFNWQYLIYKNNPFSYLKSLWSSLPKRLRAVLTLMAYSFITKYWTFVVISLFSWWEIWVVIYIWLVQYVYVIFNLAHDYCNIDLERVPWHKTCDIIVFMFQNWQYIYINKMEIDVSK